VFNITIKRADGEPIAALVLNTETGESILDYLQTGASFHGWRIVECDSTWVRLVFSRPEDAPPEKRYCFGTKFPDMISLAVFVQDGYELRIDDLRN
jgi:hypothetical protein